MRGKGKFILAVMLPIIILFSGIGVRAEHAAPSGTEGIGGEVRISSRLIELIFGERAAEAASEDVRLIPGGDVFGARIYQGCVRLREDCEELGLLAGDEVCAIDGKSVLRLREAIGAIELGGDGERVLTVKRDGSTLKVKVTAEAAKKLRECLCDGVAGIGTVTYIDPTDMSFGGLGHGICDDTGAVVPSVEGKVTGVIIGGAVKGERGNPGELSGILTDRAEGEIIANTPTGVFGKLSTSKVDKGAALPIASRGEVKAGEATIISTVKNGKKAEYKVELYDINPDESGTKCFRVRVTDKTLLALTGGIVRGMSGSPIIQDGKLVGAVTHVMVANPTEGYGIFIENMLNAAQNQVIPKAA